MYERSAFHYRDSITRHPPYGLFIDPHQGRHNWTGWNVSGRLLGLGTFAASVLIVLTLLVH